MEDVIKRLADDYGVSAEGWEEIWNTVNSLIIIERERCAQIAEKYFAVMSSISRDANTEYHTGGANIAAGIASEIRKG